MHLISTNTNTNLYYTLNSNKNEIHIVTGCWTYTSPRLFIHSTSLPLHSLHSHTTTYLPLTNLISLYFTSRIITALRFASLHSTPLRFNSLHFTPLHSTPLRFTSLHFTSPHFTSLHFTPLRFASLHFTSLHFTLQFMICTTPSLHLMYHFPNLFPQITWSAGESP
jgi:hypothetical protein